MKLTNDGVPSAVHTETTVATPACRTGRGSFQGSSFRGQENAAACPPEVDGTLQQYHFNQEI